MLERETGIEPASLAWKARVLPLNYSRIEVETVNPKNAAQLAAQLAPQLTRPFSLVERAGFEPAYS